MIVKAQTTSRRVNLLIVGLLLPGLIAVPLRAAAPRVRPAAQVEGDHIDWIKKVADWQLAQSGWDSSRNWEYGALYTGIMAAYEATRDETYLDRARQWATKYNWRMASDSRHADNQACAQAYLEMFLLDDPDPARYAHFAYVADMMVDDPRYFYCNVAGGSDVWWWCDALFMAPPAFARLSRITGDAGYLDTMHRMWGETQDCLYSPEHRLFYRDIGYFDDIVGGQPVFWARGNGWVVAGLPRVLRYLPQNDPLRGRYVTLLQEMASRLAEIQQPDGFWYANLLYPEQFGVPESSGTGFFCYGIAWGINNGILDKTTYRPVVEKAWAALKGAVHPDGKLGWVQPVGVGPNGSSYDGCYVYGVGAYLLAGSEMQKLALADSNSLVDAFNTYVSTNALKQVWQDGTANGTHSSIRLGDYGDRFLELNYDNTAAPYVSRVDRDFAPPRDWTVEDAVCLSLLIQGRADNGPGRLYAEIEDQAGRTAFLQLDDANVVTSDLWNEVVFPLADLANINLQQVTALRLGVDGTGAGTLHIDRLRLYPFRCYSRQAADFSGDCRVNLVDFAELAAQWQDRYAETLDPTDPGPSDLVAWWPLDGSYTDAAGGYDAQPVGNPQFVTGHSGQSVSLDGSSGLDVQNSAGLHLAQGGTVSAWVKSGGMPSAWACVVAKGIDAWRLIRNNTSGALSFHFNSGSTQYQANGTASVMDNEWHHVAGVYDGASVRLYIDGKLDAWAGAPNPVNSTADPVYIGSRVGRLADRSWTGRIDEVRLYDVALSEAGLFFLAEAAPVVQIETPRPTDLVLDGVIDTADLEAFLQSWITADLWP